MRPSHPAFGAADRLHLAGGVARALDGGYLQEILGPAILISIGGGLLNTPITATVTTGVARTDAGIASGLMNSGKQIGGAIGLAVLVVIASGPTGVAHDLAYDTAFAAMALILVAVGVGAWFLPQGATDQQGRASGSQ